MCLWPFAWRTKFILPHSVNCRSASNNADFFLLCAYFSLPSPQARKLKGLFFLYNYSFLLSPLTTNNFRRQVLEKKIRRLPESNPVPFSHEPNRLTAALPETITNLLLNECLQIISDLAFKNFGPRCWGPSYKRLKTDFILLLTTANGLITKLFMNLLFHQAAIIFLQFISGDTYSTICFLSLSELTQKSFR